jgi:hypothetical protein
MKEITQHPCRLTRSSPPRDPPAPAPAPTLRAPRRPRPAPGPLLETPSAAPVPGSPLHPTPWPEECVRRRAGSCRRTMRWPAATLSPRASKPAPRLSGRVVPVVDCLDSWSQRAESNREPSDYEHQQPEESVAASRLRLVLEPPENSPSRGNSAALQRPPGWATPLS